MDTKEKMTPRKPTPGPASAGDTRRRRPPAPGEGRGAARPRVRGPKGRNAKKPQSQPGQDVVYLAPKPFSRNRLILQLATLAAVVIGLILGISVFFKVEEIRVSGAQQYSAVEIMEASGIRQGENLITFNRAKAAGMIMSKLPYVKNVRIGIKLPNTVNIVIEEVRVTYAVKDTAGAWWLISSDGKVVEQAPAGGEDIHTKLLGVALLDPKPGEPAKPQEDPPAETDGEGQTVPVVETFAQKLTAAVEITACLETEGFVGEMVSVDVNNLQDIQLWYGKQFHIKLGNAEQLAYKLHCMALAIRQKGEFEGGVLDISDPSKIIFEPFG